MNPSDIESACRTHLEAIDRQPNERLTTSLRQFQLAVESMPVFADKEILGITPIYSVGVAEEAYYEVALTLDGTTPSGWILVTVDESEVPFAGFSAAGIPPSMKLFGGHEDEDRTGWRIFRYNPGYYALEDSSGRLIEEIGTRPTGSLLAPSTEDRSFSYGERGTVLENDEVHIVSFSGAKVSPQIPEESRTAIEYSEMRRRFFDSVELKRRADRLRSPSDDGRSAAVFSLPPVAGFDARHISGAHGYHKQIPPNSGYNQSGGWSGCAANAWLNLFCWWDAKGRAGLVPESKGEGTPPNRLTTNRRDAADPVQMWLNQRMGTVGGAVEFWDVHQGALWIDQRGYTRHWWYQWQWPGSGGDKTLEIATAYLWDGKKPVIVGYGNHFALGVGLMRMPGFDMMTFVEVYPGWATDDSDNEWIHYGDLHSICGVWM
jgi:hypothetical protein